MQALARAPCGSHALAEAGAAHSIVAALRRFKSDPSVVTGACSLLTTLCEDSSCWPFINGAAAVDAVHAALLCHIGQKDGAVPGEDDAVSAALFALRELRRRAVPRAKRAFARVYLLHTVAHAMASLPVDSPPQTAAWRAVRWLAVPRVEEDVEGWR